MLGERLARGIEGGRGSLYLREGNYKESETKECLVTLSVRSDSDHIASANGVTLELVVSLEDLGSLCRSSQELGCV